MLRLVVNPEYSKEHIKFLQRHGDKVYFPNQLPANTKVVPLLDGQVYVLEETIYESSLDR